MTATMKQPPEWALVESEDIYHARSKSGEVMSSGMLKRFRDCPAAYRRYIDGKISEKDSTAFRFGRAVHKICLEGIPAFNKFYAIGGPVNPKTGKNYGVGTQAHDAWLEEKGIPRDRCITEEEADVLVTMANMVWAHPAAANLLAYGWPELVVRAPLCGVSCQIRMDWLTHDADGNFVIVDLKTCDDITWFQSDSYRYQYPHQFALYRDVAQSSTNERIGFALIAAEKKEPFRVGVWTMPDEALDIYSAYNQEDLEHLKRCRAENVWPTGYEEVRVFPMPKIGA